ncbi:STAS domain-containing protein [Nonomuraea sp. NPDC050310]|uniref:STAS domain-containing protein n=1 Tax=Nonomuraea sp. NPDC050310 TaxID=3154935 RepID=UPI003402CBF4
MGLHGPCVVLRLAGKLSVTTEPVLQRRLEQAIAFRSPPWIIVEMSGLSELRGTDLGLFDEARRRIEARSGRFILVGPQGLPPAVSEVRPSLEQALRELVDEGVGRFHR